MEASLRAYWESLLEWLALRALVVTQDREESLALPERQRQARYDLRRVVSDSADMEALERLADFIECHWAIQKNPAVRPALSDLSSGGTSLRAVKRYAIRVGLFLALSRARSVLLVRIGKDRVSRSENQLVLADAKGNVHDARVGVSCWTMPRWREVSPIEAAFLGEDSWVRESDSPIWTAFVGPTRPVDLGERHLMRWIQRQAIREAEAWLLDRPHADARHEPLDRVAMTLSSTPAPSQRASRQHKSDLAVISEVYRAAETPLDALIAAERATTPGLLEQVSTVATPGQREILQLLQALMEGGFDLPDAKQVAAQTLGIAVGAIDTALSRLRDRCKGRGIGPGL